MRRLYYLFPDVRHAEQIVNALLIKRIEIKHMHTIAREDINIETLPEASIFQTNDIRHSLLLGAGTGGVLGVLLTLVAHRVFDLEFGGIMILIVFIGVAFGAWAATMIGMTTPNVELKPFQARIDQGDILLMVDVPKSRLEEIETLIKALQPQSQFKGEEPTIPTFP